MYNGIDTVGGFTLIFALCLVLVALRPKKAYSPLFLAVFTGLTILGVWRTSLAIESMVLQCFTIEQILWSQSTVLAGVLSAFSISLFSLGLRMYFTHSSQGGETWISSWDS